MLQTNIKQMVQIMSKGHKCKRLNCKTVNKTANKNCIKDQHIQVLLHQQRKLLQQNNKNLKLQVRVKIWGNTEQNRNVQVKRQRSGTSVLYLSWSMCWSASYIQNGLSMVVHSFMNSIEPPVSADMSQMARSLRRQRRDGVRRVQRAEGWNVAPWTRLKIKMWLSTSVEIQQVTHGASIHSGEETFSRRSLGSFCHSHCLTGRSESEHLLLCEAVTLITHWKNTEWMNKLKGKLLFLHYMAKSIWTTPFPFLCAP